MNREALSEALLLLTPEERAALEGGGYVVPRDYAGISVSVLADDTGVAPHSLVPFLRRLKGAVQGTGGERGGGGGGGGGGGSSPPAATPAAAGIVSFCRAVDTLLHGGVSLGRLTEVVGPVGAGKTQLLMQLALDVQIPATFGGVGGAAVLVDTEGSVTAGRLREIAAAALAHLKKHSALPSPAPTEELLLSRVLVLRVFTATQLFALAHALPMLMESHAAVVGLPVRYVGIDSIAAPLRAESGDGGTPEETGGGGGGGGGYSSVLHARQKAVALFGKALTDLAVRCSAAVVVSNHVTARWERAEASHGEDAGGEGEQKVHLTPALGNMWGHEVTDRVSLVVTPAGRRRAALEKSPDKPEGSAMFAITKQGFRDEKHV